MQIVLGDLSGPRIVDLLGIYLTGAMANSPPCSTHALDLDRLKGPGIASWTVWEGETLAGFGALLELAPDHGELNRCIPPERCAAEP